MIQERDSTIIQGEIDLLSAQIDSMKVDNDGIIDEMAENWGQDNTQLEANHLTMLARLEAAGRKMESLKAELTKAIHDERWELYEQYYKAGFEHYTNVAKLDQKIALAAEKLAGLKQEKVTSEREFDSGIGDDWRKLRTFLTENDRAFAQRDEILSRKYRVEGYL